MTFLKNISRSCRNPRRTSSSLATSILKSNRLRRIHSEYNRPICKSGGAEKLILWKNITFFVALPGVFLATVIVFRNKKKMERPPFVKYEHLRIRRKRFPWGDGDRSFFHNPKVNLLPDEDEYFIRTL